MQLYSIIKAYHSACFVFLLKWNTDHQNYTPTYPYVINPLSVSRAYGRVTRVSKNGLYDTTSVPDPAYNNFTKTQIK